ncbi:hypothetical protein [Ammoniphilus sp. 3BR4]
MGIKLATDLPFEELKPFYEKFGFKEITFEHKEINGYLEKHP